MKRILSVALILVAGSAAYGQPLNIDWTIPGGSLAIPDNNVAGITLDVVVNNNVDFSGEPNNCVEVTLTFGPAGVGHSWIGDLTATLSKVSDGSQTLFARPGRTTSGFGSSSNALGPYTFTNKTSNSLWANLGGGGTFIVPSGSYRASAAVNGAVLDLCAPFLASGSVGTWRLNINDQAAGDTGTLVAARLTLKPEPSTLALLGLGGLALIRRRRAA